MATKALAFTAAILAGSMLASQADAVIVTGTDGTRNTTATGTFANAFSQVGYYNDRVGSLVYLGNGVIITAAHVTSNSTGSVTIDGSSYNVVSGSRTRLHHPSSTSTLSDLVLLQIDVSSGGPGSAAVLGATSTGAEVRMAGRGYNRQESLTTWSINDVPSTWVWTESTVDVDAAGYKANTSGRTLRWGENVVTGSWASDSVTANYYTTFNSSGLADEAQAANGDSGGGVFQLNGSIWELVGIMYAVGTASGQPANTAVYGNITLFADIGAYQPQIDAYIAPLVPEPGTLSLLAVAGCLVLRRRRAA